MSFEKQYSEFVKTWGYEPSGLAKKAARELPEKSVILDIGAEEGTDTVFFASLGHHVTAVVVSQASVEAIEKKIEERPGLAIRVIVEDIADLTLKPEQYDLVFANMSLQFMTRGQRLELIDRIRGALKEGGLVAIIQPTVEEPAWKRLQHSREYVAGLCTLKFRGEVMNFAQIGEYRQEFAKDYIVDYHEGTVEDRGHPGFPKPHIHNIVSVVARIGRKSEQDIEKTS